MWKSFILILISATTGWANEAADLSLTEKAVKLLQIENVQRLKKSLLHAETLLKEKDQELEALKIERDQEVKTLQVELENTKSSHASQVADMKARGGGGVQGEHRGQSEDGERHSRGDPSPTRNH